MKRDLDLRTIPRLVPIPKKRGPRKKTIVVKNENGKDKKARKKDPLCS